MATTTWGTMMGSCITRIMGPFVLLCITHTALKPTPAAVATPADRNATLRLYSTDFSISGLASTSR